MANDTFNALIIPTVFTDFVGPVASPTTGEFQKSHGIAQRVWVDNLVNAASNILALA